MKEDAVIFFNALKKLDEANYMIYYLKYQLAPVIKGVKPAATLTIGNGNRGKKSKVELLKVLGKLGLKGIVLRENERAYIILIYKCGSIEQLMKDEQVKALLRKIGYPIQSVYEMLVHLKKQYAKCICPPELGVFLGFPIRDVYDYMCDGKKKCLLRGYWQVFNDVEEAKKVFSLYDEAKEEMLGQLLRQLRSCKVKNAQGIRKQM